MQDNNCNGMTTNERIHYFGLFDQFDHAMMTRDHEEVIRILRLARLNERQAKETADAIFTNPEKYGY